MTTEQWVIMNFHELNFHLGGVAQWGECESDLPKVPGSTPGGTLLFF